MTHGLSRSIPFWLLVAGSAGTTGAGAYLLTTRLDAMTTTLLEGTATNADVYVGQIWGVFGAILVGAGIIGLLLALTVASLGARRTVIPSPTPQEPEPEPESEIATSAVEDTAPDSATTVAAPPHDTRSDEPRA